MHAHIDVPAVVQTVLVEDCNHAVKHGPESREQIVEFDVNAVEESKFDRHHHEDKSQNYEIE